MTAPHSDVRIFLRQRDEVAVVRMEAVRGSSPREEGTWMLVAKDSCYGTIGGGQLEYVAIDVARALVRRNGDNKTLNIQLGPEIGQCCGGHVSLSVSHLDTEAREEFIAMEAAERDAYHAVYIFGGGHVGRALTEAFSLLPVRPIVIDTRAEVLALIDDNIDKRLTPVPEDVARNAESGSAFIILTHDHSLDFLIACEALTRTDAAYVGMIGSRTKRATFERWCRKLADMKVDTSTLICPIGVNASKDKRPVVVAAFVAAEVMAQLTASREIEEGSAGTTDLREKAHK